MKHHQNPVNPQIDIATNRDLKTSQTLNSKSNINIMPQSSSLTVQRPQNEMTSSSSLSPSHSLAADESKMDVVSCCDSFAKWANDESEVIEVLLSTVKGDHSHQTVRNMVDWNDLMENIERRESEWTRFQTQFKGSVILKDFSANKHDEIRRKLREHKMAKTNGMKPLQFESDSVSDDKLTALQRALRFEVDSLSLDLWTKKDKLLVTANTYSILQRNKERTERTIAKCTEKMDEINAQIAALQNEKKQYFSALMRTKNKLNFQIESVRETEAAIKSLHEETNSIQSEMDCIVTATESVDKFEGDLVRISGVLRDHFGRRLEPRWREWTNREVIIWLNHIEEG